MGLLSIIKPKPLEIDEIEDVPVPQDNRPDPVDEEPSPG